ncbi:MAG TPA: DNA topoisomerase [Hungateiclostridium thermocellum]|jgi:DNA gyrase subunit B|uniref:DNA topoisomerase (ATP-hydrolyzing) n=2 Tax=Acetivibrio thermocellus TaxID=1515 RepID=A3DC64_ACET2|nr:toprim domain-containing protein [Acetivibrio thermocellus]CDG34981.1 DNA topoisomerase [Acetivibrio thermocellus BC1]ABN51543.1 DNA gyrase subunit B domain protein [Acetivibrio thermocellus ATCC 27405]ADU74972.1 DNA gyrase subunit B domain protein [Acetivibrio thermocellus DSM 1313]ALX08934.1 DNA topoisomerase type IIA subunit B region 2 domain protein [Acetivibrio thermocellus AD2]ANV76684.1 DNA topoisomerase type IIA subunit B region 2 domain protein [Acetivibrio thermocellus DSM 2360]
MSKEKQNKAERYGNTSIKSLKGAERVRLRPAVIFGSDGIEGCQHSFFEILSNSIDEAREGFGKVIEVTRFKDRSIMVKDYGRGIPLDYNENEKRYNWELVFCELYAGGKYKNNSGENYEFSLGLNGLGSCATQYSSEYMDVTVFRDGMRYDLHFEKGENVGGLKKQKWDYESTGTIIKWRPDLEVFTDINIPLEYYTEVLRKQAVVNAGLKFILYDEESDRVFEYCYENGIVDYIKEVSGDKAFTDIQYYETSTRGRDREDKPEYKLKMQIAFCFNNEVNLLEYYHNSSFLEYGGAPDKAVKNAFVYVIDKFLKSQGKYNKDESRITFQDIQDSLILVSNSFSTITSYENQTKKSITNKFIQEAMTEFLKEKLEVYFIENKVECTKILEQVLVNKRSRETAEKTRVNIKKKLSGNVDISNRVKKFVDCRSKDVNKREIYIVEGDSALGSCKLARDAEFQAIIPVRGKILNCLKADYDSIFKNEIIVDLLKVLGCGVEIKSKHNRELSTFDLNNLRWSKIIICTDADVDGYQIRTLILAMLYRLVPTLIQVGKVFIAESPLFEIRTKDKTYFAYTDKEKNEIVSKLKGKYTILRSKGLGENDPDMMWQTTMNPETRRLIQVVPDDIKKTEEFFDLFLGDNLPGRKSYIEEHGHKYLDMIDVM